MPSVLFVFSSVDINFKKDPTGYSLPEVAHPYYVLAPLCDISFASPNGRIPPVDPKSKKLFCVEPDCEAFLSDEVVQGKMRMAHRLRDVQPEEFDVLFYVGGYGSVVDLPNNVDNIQMASKFIRAGKIVGAVCHGVAALANVTIGPEGRSIISGRRFTGFYNVDEPPKELVAGVKQKMIDDGGKYKSAEEIYEPEVVVDGLLYTGQNASSARPLAVEILRKIKRIYEIW